MSNPSSGIACPLSGAACMAVSAPAAGAGLVVDRRAMLTQSMVAAAALALTACGIADYPTASTTLVTFTLKVKDYSALANIGGVALVTESGSPIAIVRTGDSSYIALSRVCPHRGATIGLSGDGFLCPRHQSRYDLNGAWLAGPSTRNMFAYAATYDTTTDTLTIG